MKNNHVRVKRVGIKITDVDFRRAISGRNEFDIKLDVRPNTWCLGKEIIFKKKVFEVKIIGLHDEHNGRWLTVEVINERVPNAFKTLKGKKIGVSSEWFDEDEEIFDL